MVALDPASLSLVPHREPVSETNVKMNDLMMSIKKVKSGDTRARSDAHPECCGYSLTTDRGVYHVLHVRGKLPKIPVGAVHYLDVSDTYGLRSNNPLSQHVVAALQNQGYTHVNYLRLRDGCMPLTLTSAERRAWLRNTPVPGPVRLHNLVHLTHGGAVVHNMVGTAGLSDAYSASSSMNEYAEKYREALEIHNRNRTHNGCGAAKENGEPCDTVTTSPSLCHVALTADTSNLYSNMARQYLEDRKYLRYLQVPEDPEDLTHLRFLQEYVDDTVPDLTCYGVFACAAHNAQVLPFKVHRDAPLFRMQLSFHRIPSETAAP